MQRIEAQQVTDAVAYHGEGPVWWPGWGGLRWVDMLAGDVLQLRDDGSVDRLHVGDVVAFVRPRRSGGWVAGLERGIGLADDVDDAPEPVLELWTDPGVRMNEGGCDDDGVLFAGSMAYDVRPGGATLYRIGPDLDARPWLERVTISNGVDFSPDGSVAYYDDTETGVTHAYDVVGGRWTARRVLADGDGGRPDGLVVDAAGNVWVAHNGAGRARCFSPAGELLAEVTVPARLVTACTLGGPDLRDLYLSTSRENLDDPEPEAGALFRARVEVPGRPVRPFGG